ncbi:MAG: transposase [Candidatus Bathyarchaeia archaeon]
MVKGRRRAIPGIVCVLRIDGRDLQLKLHVHVLATEGGLTKQGEWIRVTFLEYIKLRRIWQYQLLTAVKRQIPKRRENSRLFDTLFKNYLEGFYIYAKRMVTKPKKIARYIGRYLHHPAIAESRITDFNPETNTVTFWYQLDGVKRRTVTTSALDFINHLVELIPDENLKLWRRRRLSCQFRFIVFVLQL